MAMKPQESNRARREEMVHLQIERRGVRDARVLEAMRTVPREQYVSPGDLEYAFHDGPLSIGSGQTISQPYIVAYMTEQLRLRGDERVLEVGTGSGYQAAVLAELAAEVYTIEVVPELARIAEAKLLAQGYANIRFRVGDGALGWPEAAPFDAIMLTAAPWRIPERLVDQLSDGGRMILPLGAFDQHLELVTRQGGRVDRRELIGVRFVPMIGAILEDGA